MRHLIISTVLWALSSTLHAAHSYQPCAWERQIVAACLVLEAADQGNDGMRAVAAVIANRGHNQPSKYLALVKKPYAFSALNQASTGKTGGQGYAGLVSRASKDRSWPAALAIVEALYQGTLADNTYGADHYSRRDRLPSWSHRMQATTVIGDHLFFKSR